MLILASKSPRRRELLRGAGYNFKIIPAESEEITPDTEPAAAAVKTAEAKALEVAEKHPKDVVLAADTIVVHNGKIMNKPSDKAEAFRMLRALSGQRHTVITGVVVIAGGVTETFCQRTSVEFYPLSDEEINAYIDTDEPFDKAGGYGIQERGALLVKCIRGDYFNVMGLPIAKTARLLKKYNIKPE